jgi:peroxiredoxin Q/BCP
MSRFVGVIVVLALIGSMLGSPTRLRAEELKPGDPAPEFSLPGSDGKTYRLADYRGKQMVVIAWFPKAFTSGCTTQCKALAAHDSPLRQYDVALFMASLDTPEDNQKFADTHRANFPILSASPEVARAYGVVNDQRTLPHRWTFYIGKDGKLLAIDKHVRPATHPADVAQKLEELGATRKP